MDHIAEKRDPNDKQDLQAKVRTVCQLKREAQSKPDVKVVCPRTGEEPKTGGFTRLLVFIYLGVDCISSTPTALLRAPPQPPTPSLPSL